MDIMSIISEKTNNSDVYIELCDLKSKSFQKSILKSLLALTLLVLGVASIIFMNINFLPYGIGLILISSVAIYHYLKHHHHSNQIFSRAAKAIAAHHAE